MRAIRIRDFGDPEVMVVEDMPDLQPGPGEVLIRVKAVGVNPVDTYIRSGQYPHLPELPYTPGFDAAGVIEAVGSGVECLTAGAAVYTAGTITGAYAEQTLCHEYQAHPMPDGIGFRQGAAMGIPYAIAYRALLLRANARPGDTVLVHGATGGVGVATTQLAVNSGMTVIATAGSEKGLELVLSQGAHHALDHRNPDHLDQVMEITGGSGVNVAVEMLADINLGKDLKVLAQGGRVVVVGSRGTVEIDPRDLMMREASIHGALLFAASPEELRETHARLRAGLRNGALRPLIGREFPLADAPRAHEAVLGSKAYGKIVLIP